jgi:hypothetical protein
MESSFILNLNTKIICNGESGRPVLNAVSILRRDMEKTCAPSSGPENHIRITEADTKIEAESWIIEVSAGEITIRYGGSLGCVYALLFISAEFLSVTPFWFWNDQRFTKREFVNIPLGTRHSPRYAARYRGWFINDEVLIENWRREPENTEHWAMVFEALLRLGGNMVIPGTDTNSRKYRSLANDMGLWISHHHAEPLGAEMFLRAYPDQNPSYAVNGHLFEKLWEQAVVEQKDYRVIWGLGFRGQGDRPFWAEDPACASAKQRGRLIGDVIKRQYEILKRRVDNPVCCVNLYGEIIGLYRDGYLDLPPGIIKVWSDNGYGRMVSRRQGGGNPRVHALPSDGDGGPHGIYYHCSFHDLQASNHLTMSPNSTGFLAAELEKVLEAGAGEYWIVNCGSVKPHLYTLDMVSEMWRNGHIDVNTWRLRYAQKYYGGEKAEEIAALFGEYASCTARYGPNEDDRAGEQIWHHPVRELLCRWMAGGAKNGLDSLVWLAGDAPFCEQLKKLEETSRECLPKWNSFCEKCAALRPALDDGSRLLFEDSLFLQARLQRAGAAGALAFCESFGAFAAGDSARAFGLAEQSRSHYAESVSALAEAEHGKWAGYYDGDCLTDIRLTLFCLEALVSYLRVLGDGPDFHQWERRYLMPAAERSIMLLSSKQRALTNEALAAGLKQTKGKL